MGDDTRSKITARRTVAAEERLAPPRRPMASMDDVAVFAADDIMALPLERGSLERDEAASAASEINDALAEALHIATTEPVEHSSSHAKWSATVGTLARDLVTSLSSLTPGESDVPFDALELLKPELPTGAKCERAKQLRALLIDAVPTKSPRETDELILLALSRLAPGLRALSLLAERAEEHWTGSIRRGGSKPDLARRHLIARVACVYETLSHTPLTVRVRFKDAEGRTHRPGGPALDWFGQLFVLVEERLPIAEGVAPLRLIATTARIRSDALANWLREFRATHVKPLSD